MPDTRTPRPVTSAEYLAASMLRLLEVGGRRLTTEGGAPVREALLPEGSEVERMIREPPPRWDEALRAAREVVDLIVDAEPPKPRSVGALVGDLKRHALDVHEVASHLLGGGPPPRRR